MVATKRCAWGTCANDSRLPHVMKKNANGDEVDFLHFPGVKYHKEKRERWIRACHRGDGFVCTKHSYICSLHFVGESGPTADYPDPISAVKSSEKIIMSAQVILRSTKYPAVTMELPSPDHIPSETYDKAEVLSGSWGFYDSVYGKDRKYKILYVGEEAVVDFYITQAKAFEYQANGICLFAQHNFFGENKTYTEDTADVNPPFPQNDKSGVSSVIVFDSKNWRLNNGVNMSGTLAADVGPGQYPDISQVPPLKHDIVRSIKLL